jgi:uncharacterized membrane protein YkoI
MNKMKKIALPAFVAVAGFLGVSGASLASNLTASADTTTATTAASTTTSSAPTAAAANTSGPHVANGITETPLTGDTYAKAVAAAQAAEAGATVVRAETDAEGAKYEVHMIKTDGSEATVKLDANFTVTSTEAGK